MSDGAVKERHFRVYVWLLSYLTRYKWQTALFILSVLLISLTQMSIFRVLQYIIDHVIMESDLRKFWIVAAGLLAILAVMFVAMAGSNTLARLVKEKAARDLQFDCMKQLRRLGFSYFEQHGVGETLSLLNSDVGAVQEIYQKHFPQLISNFLLLFVAIGFVIYTNAELALVTFPGFLLFYLIGPFLAKKVTYWGRKARDLRTYWNKRIYESVTGIVEFKTYRRETWQLDRVAQAHKEFNHSQRNQMLFRILRGTARKISNFCCTLLMFLYGFYLFREGTLSIGEFTVFILYYEMLSRQSAQIVSLMIEQDLLLHQGEKIKHFMELSPEVSDPVDPVVLPRVEGRLDFQNVRFSYNSRQVLQDFNLSVNAGERIVLVGSSGNGKTTILKLIGRFYDPDQGDILLDGVPLRNLSMAQLRESIGFVFQETYLFGSTIRDNIRFGRPEATDKEIEDAARAAYAHEFIEKLPNGYDTQVGERGVKLSGGQRQRIAIARMFVKNPKIIVLDEATAALDNVSEHEVLKALDRLMENRTTIAVAHRLSTIRQYERIAVVKDGRIAEVGTYDQLVMGNGWLSSLDAKQTANGA